MAPPAEPRLSYLLGATQERAVRNRYDEGAVQKMCEEIKQIRKQREDRITVMVHEL